MIKENVAYPCNGIIMKRNELSIHTTSWMDLKLIMLSERSQREGRTHTIVSFI